MSEIVLLCAAFFAALIYFGLRIRSEDSSNTTCTAGASIKNTC